MKRRVFSKQLLIGLFGALLVSRVIVFFVSPLPVFGQPPEPTPDWNELAAEEIQRDLANPSLDIFMHGSLEEKLAGLSYQEDLSGQINAQSQGKPEDLCAGYPSDSGWEEYSRPIGINWELPVPFRASDAVIINQWQDQYAGYWVHVYAGASGADPNQGILIVEFEGNPELGGWYAAPEADGALTIRSANAARLTLESASGAVIYFDVPSLQFTNDPEAALPALELPARPEPTPGPCGN